MTSCNVFIKKIHNHSCIYNRIWELIQLKMLNKPTLQQSRFFVHYAVCILSSMWHILYPCSCVHSKKFFILYQCSYIAFFPRLSLADPTVKYSVLIWDCVTAKVEWKMTCIHHIMNTSLYTPILCHQTEKLTYCT